MARTGARPLAQPLAEEIRGYLQYLVVERGLAPNTVDSYRRDLRRYESLLAVRGKTGIADVTAADVAEFLASLREGDDEHVPLAVSSAARAVIAVRGLHAFAFVLAQKPVIDEDAGESVAESLVAEEGGDRGVDPSRHGHEHSHPGSLPLTDPGPTRPVEAGRQARRRSTAASSTAAVARPASFEPSRQIPRRAPASAPASRNAV